ncbi:MAG: GNAT family N-acetyltransferase [Clostridia bacterium]|nr:GNAT family N-acetyltransferase [Clostridia bacterium]MBR3563325.1 GNAT family N-acetyltransferase [Clostridia bacterium]
MIFNIRDREDKKKIAREVLEDLKDWFENDEGRENLIKESEELTFLADREDGQVRGFLAIRKTGDVTCEIAVIGVKKAYRGTGIGRVLVETSKAYARAMGAKFLQVKTVKKGMYKEYDQTNDFYRSVGFGEFEVIEDLWDEANPCQIYIMAL